MRRNLVSAGVCLLCACTQSIPVLGPAPSSVEPGSDAGAMPPAMSPRRDGGLVPDPDDIGGSGGGGGSGGSGGATPAPGCGGCGVGELCAASGCVDASGVISLDSTFAHTCQVTDGRLFCWGVNAAGQLGVGDRLQRDRPMRVGTFNDWLKVAAGEDHTCAIRSPGQLYCWGDNSSGQLALGDVQTRLSPTAAGAAAVFLDVSCGGDGCCALDAGSALLCWGDNREGKLGQADLGGAPDGTRPLVVEPGSRWREVRVGQGNVCAIRSDGELYCWGRNSDAQLGTGPDGPVQTRTPTRVGSDTDWARIATSQHHSCAIKSDGTLWCWGSNVFFELAAPDPALQYPPVQVGSDGDWADVTVSWFHGCALKRDARLFCWGRAIEGQLGQGGSVDPLPQPNEVAMPARWQRIAVGNMFTCGIDESSALYCWGINSNGQLGLGDDLRRHEPTPVP